MISETNWKPTFAYVPRKTINNRWVWMQRVYVRRVYVYTGLIDELEPQYATLFDIIAE